MSKDSIKKEKLSLDELGTVSGGNAFFEPIGESGFDYDSISDPDAYTPFKNNSGPHEHSKKQKGRMKP